MGAGIARDEPVHAEEAQHRLAPGSVTTGSPHASASSEVLPPDQCSVSSITSQAVLTRRYSACGMYGRKMARSSRVMP